MPLGGELLRERLLLSFRRLLPLGGEWLRERLLLAFLLLLLLGDWLRDIERDLLGDFRSLRCFFLGVSLFFKESGLEGGDFERSPCGLSLLLRFLPLGGELLETRRPGDIREERFLSLPLPLGGDLLEDRRIGVLLTERLLSLPLPPGDILLEDLRGDLLVESLRTSLPLFGDRLESPPLCGDLRADWRGDLLWGILSC